MAASGSFNGTTGGKTGLYLVIAYKESDVDTASNTSKVEVTLTLKHDGLWVGAGTDDCKVWVGNQNYSWTGPDIYDRNVGSSVKLGSHVFTVPHDSDGTWKKQIGASYLLNITYAGSHVGTISGAQTVALTAIARASVPTVSASTRKMGQQITIYTNRAVSSFTHTLQYEFGSASGTIATGINTSYTWTIPDLSDICNNATGAKCTVKCITYSGNTKIGEKTVQFQLNVPDAVTPTVAGGKIIIGEPNTIYLNGAAKNFKMTLAYTFKTKSGPIVSGIRGQQEWTPAYSLASEIPALVSAEGTITCTTKNGTATVGTKTAKFQFTVLDNETTRPTINSLTLEPSGTVPASMAGLYVRAKTGIKGTFDVTSVYSSIASCELRVLGGVYRGNPATTDPLSASGDVRVIGVVTDARGYTASVEQTLSVFAYDAPRVVPYAGEKAVICERCTSDGTPSRHGEYLRIKAGRSYSKIVSDAEQKNFCVLRYRLKASSAAEYSDWITLLAANATDTDQIIAVKTGTTLLITTSYDVQIAVEDSFGTGDLTKWQIGTDLALFHLRESYDGAGIGKYGEVPGAVDMGWNISMNGNKLDGLPDPGSNTAAARKQDVTEAVAQALLKAHPVGSIYISMNDTDPAELFGGSWEPLKDRFLLAAGDTYTGGDTGGEATHTLTVAEMPNHRHLTAKGSVSDSSTYEMLQYQTYQAENSITPGKYWTAETLREGGSQAHNNMPPYLVVYVWKRTA